MDEVDSVLIDNCRNPQLISAPPIDVQEERQLANMVRPGMQPAVMTDIAGLHVLLSPAAPVQYSECTGLCSS